MKMKRLVGILSLSLVLLVGGQYVTAEEISNYEVLYNQGIQEGYINSEELSLDNFEKNNEEFNKVYEDGKTENIIEDSLSYSEWLKLNNYGQYSNETVNEQPQGRGWASGFYIRRGDVLVTNGTSSAGFLGHAAIANGENQVLDMPGSGRTSRQMSSQAWVNEYKGKGWVRGYRTSSGIADNAARWADRNYFSTNGTANQNIFPSYSITTQLYSKNPSYCSKLVFQAYCFGTGSVPVMKNSSGIVTPYGLMDRFNANYRPSLIHIY